MGISSVVVIALGVVRQKFIAVMLGPDGIGILGLLSTGLTLGSTIFGLGLSSSGVRYVATAKGEGSDELERTRTALVYGSHALGLFGGLCCVVFRHSLATWILEDPTRASWIAWLGVALWASVVSGGQLAVINGLRRIGDLARASIIGGVAGTLATIVGIFVSSETGLIAAVIAPPVATGGAAWWLSRDIRPLPLLGAWRALGTLFPMVALGLIVSLSLTAGSATQFLSRLLVQRTLTLDDAGYFQASWSISKVYLGFVLTALSAEYYPRISALAQDASALNREVRLQIRIVLLLAGPAIIGLIAGAPFVVNALYSNAFADTVPILRWQLVGDVLKVVSWTLAFLLLAREAKWKFLSAELTWNIVYLLSLVLLLPRVGLIVTGTAYAGGYAVYLMLCWRLASSESRFSFGYSELGLLAGFTGAALATLFVSRLAFPGSLIASGILFLASCIFSLSRLRQEGQFSMRRMMNLVRGRYP